jgi:3-oxoadipate enol-lactonase
MPEELRFTGRRIQVSWPQPAASIREINVQFADINGINIHYQLIGGPAGAPVLVFANALGTDFRIWRDVVIRLAGDFPIITYDLRGQGLSDIGTSPYSMDDHVDDLIGLLDLLAVRNAVICGLSAGGVVAQGVYARRPDLVHALVLCCTAHKIGTADSWNGRIAAVEANGIASILDDVMQKWFTPEFRKPGNAEHAGYRNMVARQPVAGYVGTCAAIRDADLTQSSARIAVPTLCVAGDQDGSTPPETVLGLARLVPDARYELIKGAGHMPCIEQPDHLAAMIRAFLQEVDAA